MDAIFEGKSTVGLRRCIYTWDSTLEQVFSIHVCTLQ